jgi:hypothetical protein
MKRRGSHGTPEPEGGTIPRLSRAAVATLTERALGVPVVRVECDHLGASNAVYFVTLASNVECVVRILPAWLDFCSLCQG